MFEMTLDLPVVTTRFAHKLPRLPLQVKDTPRGIGAPRGRFA
jgi:hypothetical protein